MQPKASLAFRSGNRLNHPPFVNTYEIQRIDVGRNKSESAFKWTVWVAMLLERSCKNPPLLNRKVGEQLLILLFDCHLRSEVGRHCQGTNSVWLQNPDSKAFVLSRQCGLPTCRNPDSTLRECVERLGVRLLSCGLPRTRGLTPFVAAGWGRNVARASFGQDMAEKLKRLCCAEHV